MPLLKLWNTFRGRSHAETPAAADTATPSTNQKPSDAIAPPAKSAIKKQPEAAAKSVQPPTPVSVVAKPARKSGLNLFGSAGPHAALCKQIKSMSVRSVLEINVEDGSRAIAVLETLMKNLPAEASATLVDSASATNTANTRRR